MRDVIERRAAIEELHACQKYLFDSIDYDLKISLEDAENAIQRLPSAGPRWIPVTERLPDTIDTVLVSNKTGTSTAWYNGYNWERGSSTNHRELKTVTAWMPLPEPYREIDDE